MEKTSSLEKQREIYLKVAERQVKMAEALKKEGFYEGSIFHSYQALEAACASAIAHKGVSIPWGHKEKIKKFKELFPDVEFSDRFNVISGTLLGDRERTTYADIEAGIVRDPTLEFTESDAEDAIKDVGFIINEIKKIEKDTK